MKLLKSDRNSSGFTLIELSIVLVIIGLLAGGVVVARDLVKSAEIRGVVSQMEEFKTAANSFKLKYNFLPADIPPNHTANLGFFTYTGTYAGRTYEADIGNAWLGTQRYGFGDNSGMIEFGEFYVFWQHLSEARMIKGVFGGTTVTNYLRSSTNVFSIGGYPVSATPNISDYDIFQPQTNLKQKDKHILPHANRLYSARPFYNGVPSQNLFQFYATTGEQYAIDSKMDDGVPNTGTVRDSTAIFGNIGNTPCTTGATPNAYNISAAQVNVADVCALHVLW